MFDRLVVGGLGPLSPIYAGLAAPEGRGWGGAGYTAAGGLVGGIGGATLGGLLANLIPYGKGGALARQSNVRLIKLLGEFLGGTAGAQVGLSKGWKE